MLALEGVGKAFPNGTVALRDARLTVESGSVHGLVGANGAGKSTMIKIIAGAHAPSEGTVRWKGAEVSWRGPGAARNAGIATIMQHVPLAPTLTVLENVFLGASRPWRLPRTRGIRSRLLGTANVTGRCSPGSTRTGLCVASATTCHKKHPRPSLKPSSKSTGSDRREFTPGGSSCRWAW
jgi:ABC-type uncharacterized transport system ATPase subunit